LLKFSQTQNERTIKIIDLTPKTPSTILYLDTEFTSLNKTAHLISLALIAHNGSSFYAEFTDYPTNLITPWISQNVLANLYLKIDNPPVLSGKHWEVRATTEIIVDALCKFLATFDSIKIWADHVAYDWVLFCDLFGGARQLPNNIHYMPLDLPTALFMKGFSPDINRIDFVGKATINTFPKVARQRHNALYDAYLLKACVERLNNNNRK